jgi:glycosyltransferase involved in cell wall biosynthesis
MLARNGDPVRVVTDHGELQNFVPYRVVRPSPRLPRLLRAAVQAWDIWRTSRRQPGTTAIVTYGTLTAYALACLQALLRPFVAPRTHLVFDLLMERRRHAGPAALFDRWKAWSFRHGGMRAVVWGQDDGDVFAAEYDLPRDRFQFHPYHTTLEGFELDPGDDGFIFAGGNFGRDYATLLAAVRDIDYPVVVATTNPAIPPLAEGLPHVTVRGVSPTEFRRLLSRCTFLVEAHPHDFIRTAGHQTLLNAMSMGKPIVLADRRSAPGYLENGVEGLVVDAGNVADLAGAIRTLLDDPERRQRMASAGLARLQNPIYGTAQHMQSIYNYALRLEHVRTGTVGEPVLIEMYGPAGAGVVPRELERNP